jgi:hypothetical protein
MGIKEGSEIRNVETEFKERRQISLLFDRHRFQTPNATENTNSRARKLRAVIGNLYH